MKAGAPDSATPPPGVPRCAPAWAGRLGFVVWLALVVCATAQLMRYAGTAGDAGLPPAAWPEPSRLAIAGGRPALVLFLHPRCPCSRATLGELEELLAQGQGRLRTHVLFLKPAGVADNWAKTDLWRRAAALPGVAVQADDAGAEAQLFRARTSGHALLYDGAGRLQFSGGITGARGHAGDNAGRRAVLAHLRGELPAAARTAVFGCPLTEAGCAQGKETECQP